MKMNQYRVKVTGTLTYPTMVTVENEYGETVEVNDTAGIEYNGVFTAETHLLAKEKFKTWVAEQVNQRDAISFNGSISAWLVTEQPLLTNAPFKVEVEVTKTIIVDF